MERREAQHPDRKGCARLRTARGGPDRKGLPKGASQAPWRLPALHSLRGKEKGTGLPGAAQRTRAMTRACTKAVVPAKAGTQ